MKKTINILSGLKFEPCEEPYVGVKANGSIVFGDCGVEAPKSISNKTDSEIEKK